MVVVQGTSYCGGQYTMRKVDLSDPLRSQSVPDIGQPARITQFGCSVAVHSAAEDVTTDAAEFRHDALHNDDVRHRSRW